MGYRCHVCGFTAISDALLARHMVNTFTLCEQHLEWIESKGVIIDDYSPFRSLREQKTFYDDLREVIRRECPIGERVTVA